MFPKFPHDRSTGMQSCILHVDPRSQKEVAVIMVIEKANMNLTWTSIVVVSKDVQNCRTYSGCP